MTKRGLLIEFPLFAIPSQSSIAHVTYSILNCWSTTDFEKLVAVPLEGDPEAEDSYIRDRNLHGKVILGDAKDMRRARTRKIYIKKPLMAETHQEKCFSIRLGPGVPHELVEMKPYRRP
jgi:hypothetical protein